MRYLFIYFCFVSSLLSAQGNKDVKFFLRNIILRNNSTGKSVHLWKYNSNLGILDELDSRQLIAALGGHPISKGGGGEIFALENHIYGQDTIQYEWSYTDDPKDNQLHEVGFYGFIFSSPNFSIGDDRSNTFIRVGDKAEILKKWFPKLDMEHSVIDDNRVNILGKLMPKFTGVQFDFVGVRDKETGKWLSVGYIWVHCKKDGAGQWVISKIETYTFEWAQPID